MKNYNNCNFYLKINYITHTITRAQQDTNYVNNIIDSLGGGGGPGEGYVSTIIYLVLLSPQIGSVQIDLFYSNISYSFSIIEFI